MNSSAAGTHTIHQLVPVQHNQDQAAINVMEAITSEDRNFVSPTNANSRRPWVYANMVSSLDGATAVDGVSASLGGPADQQVFSALRAQADIIIAGAQTVRAERYRAPQTSVAVQTQRMERNQSARPIIAVVSGSASLTPDLRLFDDPSYEPILVTGSDARPETLAALEPKMRIIQQSGPQVNLVEMLETLASDGHRRCLVEGGPSLNGQFVANGLIDEWNMTLSPVLASGSSARSAHGPTPAEGQSLDLVRLWHAEGLLFGRWLTRRD